MKKAECIFFQNRENRQIFRDFGIKGKSECLVNGSGVDLIRHTFEPYPTDEKCQFLFVGRVMKERGITEFLEAAKKLHNENLFTTYLGFPQKGFFSADYFSLLPWFFLFLTGFYLYQLVQKNHMMEKLFSWRVPGFDVIGRHSLLIYLLHQPAVFGISWLLFQI